ncbi:MAG: peptide chain release factor N(5)-glutamine methyltransferase [Gemmatimonadales bacterium]
MSNTVQQSKPTVSSVVEQLASKLHLAGITDARRTATDILAAVLEVPRLWPVMNREAAVDSTAAVTATRAAERMVKGAPFGYAVGCVAFRHLNLVVDERVLIPRPETELLVEEILLRMEKVFRNGRPWGTAADIGTGSGAIALSLASEGRFQSVIATDASNDALTVARINASRSATALRVRVDFRQGSLLAPLGGQKVAVLASNPPYVSFAEMDSLPPSVRDWEPPIALFSGHDGLAATKELVRAGSRNLMTGGLLALEVDERRASLVAEMVMRHGTYMDVGVRLDLAGRERFVFASRI